MAAQPTPTAQTGGKPRLPEGDMFISIDNPAANEVAGPSLAVNGTYDCPQSKNPYIKCVLKPGNGNNVNPSTLNYSGGYWEAFFQNVSPGDYTAKAVIKHDKDSSSEKHSTVSLTVQTDPGLATSTPQTGATESAGQPFPVRGTVDQQYSLGGYQVHVYGTAAGNIVTGDVQIIDLPQDGSHDPRAWSTSLTVPSQESNVVIHADLWANGASPAISEEVVGEITIGESK